MSSVVYGPGDDRSVKDLLADFSQEASTLIRKELELARVEMKDSASLVAQAGAMFTAAGVLAFLALQALTVALGFGLAAFMPDGVAALVVGVLYLALAGGIAMGAKRRAADVSGPKQTVETIKEDVQVAKESLSKGTSSEASYGRPWASTRN